MKNFVTKHYVIESEKVHGRGVKLALMADLHGLVFGEENSLLLGAVEHEQPDAVLVAGDMLLRMEEDSCERARRLLQALAGRYPVFYGMGNHESKMACTELWEQEYANYERGLEADGVHVLHNSRRRVQLGGTDFLIHGLELPLEYYRKPGTPKLSVEKLEHMIGLPAKDCFNILIAHNPRFGNTYFSWGAELTVSGHYHGGLVRFTEHVGLCSPQYRVFPPYCCGDFHRGGGHMIVSAGLGEHTIPLRIHNPRELILITIKPLPKMKNAGKL